MKYKGYRQRNEFDCGEACLKTILKFYDVKSRISKYKAPLSLYDIVIESEKNGLVAHAMKGDFNELEKAILAEEIKLPVIAHFEKEFGMHYEVIFEISKKQVLSYDPASDFKVYTIAEFQSKWTGYLINFRKLGVSNEDY
ncbi:MAG: hypothetical protein LBI13_01975 [Streptococcaceae bacterium]|jgi:ATP-binding cassette subfamily B protein|nr:hypothetical protein [Streptococcaceae bacterium]